MTVLADPAASAFERDALEETPAARAWRRLKRRRSAMLGLVVIAALILVAVFAPWIAPYDPVKQIWTAVRKAPSALYWFGSDESGRDLFSRVVYGARASLMGRISFRSTWRSVSDPRTRSTTSSRKATGVRAGSA